MVGNGSGGGRSNAYTLDDKGNAWFAGDIKIGGTGYDAGKTLQQYLEDLNPIVEEGDITTSDYTMWHYRKMKNGFAECWGKYGWMEVHNYPSSEKYIVKKFILPFSITSKYKNDIPYIQGRLSSVATRSPE